MKRKYEKRRKLLYILNIERVLPEALFYAPSDYGMYYSNTEIYISIGIWPTFAIATKNV